MIFSQTRPRRNNLEISVPTIQAVINQLRENQKINYANFFLVFYIIDNLTPLPLFLIIFLKNKLKK